MNLQRRILSRRHFLLIIAKFYYYILVLTKKQLEKLSKVELIDELLTVNSIHDELANKYLRVESELEISKNCTKILSKQIVTLQRNASDSSQYLRREMIEVNPVAEDIQDMQEHE